MTTTLKCLEVKFTRNPKFTPALPESELDRIERVAREYAARHFQPGQSLGKVGEQAAQWIVGHDANSPLHESWGELAGDWSWCNDYRTGGKRFGYLKTCVNFIVAVGLNKREFMPERQMTRRDYAVARNGEYGY